MPRDRAGGAWISLAILLLAVIPSAATEDDPWAELRRLVGKWEGTGSGFGTTSTVSHAWDFVLGDRFLRLRTRSVSVRNGGTEDVHEDVGYVSLDSDRGTFVFRQFLSEGFVNTYDLTLHTDDPRGIEFSYRESESGGGMRARMRLTFTGADEYGLVLELASPGKDFAACQEMIMRRMGAGDASP